MLDIAFLAAFSLLPMAIWWVSRSVTFLAVGLALGIGLAGNLVQTLIALGVDWNIRALQTLILVVMLLLALVARFFRHPFVDSRRAQVVAVGVPAVILAAGLIGLRLLAPEDPGALSAVGYFMNHPLAEDNAKWLHLSAQVADGRAISFNGYAGGPLLLLMAALSPLISVLSMIWFGSVNQVAVAANSVLAVQFFLIAAAPFALAPLTQWRHRPESSYGVPPAILWVSGGFLALASAVVTSYGHLSQQFTLIVLTLWVLAFLTAAPRWVLLVTSLTVATTVSVWMPLNILGLAIIASAVILTLRYRWWQGFALTSVTLMVTFDAIVSSIVYLFGLQVRLNIPNVGGFMRDFESAAGSGEMVSNPPNPGELIASAHLFRAPGAAEQISAVLAILAVVVALGAVWFMNKRMNLTGILAGAALMPLLALLAYTLAMTMADAFVTGSSPNYGATKMAFTIGVVAIAATLPFGLMGLDPEAAGMSVLRWAGVAALVALLMFDSLLPRGLSALSPVLWKGVDSGAPVYWSPAEIRETGDQPLSASPIACVFAPRQASAPTALPLGQEAYACTRLLTGLSGLEGDAGVIAEWLRTDWQSQTQTWFDFRDAIAESGPQVLDRQLIVIGEDGGVAGLQSVRELLDRFPPIADDDGP